MYSVTPQVMQTFIKTAGVGDRMRISQKSLMILKKKDTMEARDKDWWVRIIARQALGPEFKSSVSIESWVCWQMTVILPLRR